MDFLVKDLIKINNYPSLDDITFDYNNITKILKEDSILFDTLFYGVSGAGKTTLFMAYLQKLFGTEILNLVPTNDSKSSDITFTIEKVGSPLSNSNLIVINDSVSDDV